MPGFEPKVCTEERMRRHSEAPIPSSPPFDAFRYASFAHGRPRKTYTLQLPSGLRCVECPEPVEGLSYVYILFCHNGTFYTGQSQDIQSRLKRHSEGAGARHTLQLKEFELVYTEGPLTKELAIKRERQLKKWSKAKKMALIQGDWNTPRKLSKSRE